MNVGMRPGVRDICPYFFQCRPDRFRMQVTDAGWSATSILRRADDGEQVSFWKFHFDGEVVVTFTPSQTFENQTGQRKATWRTSDKAVSPSVWWSCHDNAGILSERQFVNGNVRWYRDVNLTQYRRYIEPWFLIDRVVSGSRGALSPAISSWGIDLGQNDVRCAVPPRDRNAVPPCERCAVPPRSRVAAPMGDGAGRMNGRQGVSGLQFLAGESRAGLISGSQVGLGRNPVSLTVELSAAQGGTRQGAVFGSDMFSAAQGGTGVSNVLRCRWLMDDGRIEDTIQPMDRSNYAGLGSVEMLEPLSDTFDLSID